MSPESHKKLKKVIRESQQLEQLAESLQKIGHTLVLAFKSNVILLGYYSVVNCGPQGDIMT